MIGIEFTMVDGSQDSYDPVNFPDDFTETDTHYILNLTWKYEILKADVKNIRHFELCQKCGYELYPTGCKNCEK